MEESEERFPLFGVWGAKRTREVGSGLCLVGEVGGWGLWSMPCLEVVVDCGLEERDLCLDDRVV